MRHALRAGLLGFLLLQCEKVGDRGEARVRVSEAPSVVATAPGSVPEPDSAPAPDAGVVTAASTDVSRPPQEPGTADLDASNDDIVAPPDAIEDCDARLEALGVSFTHAELGVHASRGVVCGAPQAVVYKGRKGGVRWSSAPVVSCTLALALARFEQLADEEARRAFGVGLRSIEHGGTYNCRKMARFRGIVSEHSYANAIDLRSFRLGDGRKISVLQHFGRPAREPTSAEGRFLRTLARKAYDGGIFSVVLTEFFDTLHRDHFHVDMARYRVDGTR